MASRVMNFQDITAAGGALAVHTHVIADVTSLQGSLDAKLSTAAYTASDVLAKLLTVDGMGSGLDADLLDGQSSSYYLTATNLSGGTLPAGRLPAFTGDITTSAGSVATTLATVNSNVGAFGSATAAPVVTVNAKGLVTAVSTATVTPAWTSITSKPTTLSGYGITDALANNIAANNIGTGLTNTNIALNIGTGTGPGIGYTTAINFTRQTDSAGIAVTETASDITLYEFFMADNPDGGDYFSWRFGDWQGPNGVWQPLYIGSLTNRIQGTTTNLSTSLTQPTAAYFTTGDPANSTASKNIVIMNDNSKLKTATVGTVTITSLNVLNYSGTSGIHMWIKLTSATTFNWGYSSPGGVATQTGLAVATSPVLLSNGITVTFSSTTAGANGDIFTCRVWSRPTNSIGQTTVNGQFAALSGSSGVATLHALGAGYSGGDVLLLKCDSADTAASYIKMQANTAGTADTFANFRYAGSNFLNIVTPATTIKINSNNVWHAGNDGLGSGLDADLLDGIDGGNYTRADLTFLGRSGNQTFDATTDTPAEWAALPVGYSRMMSSTIGTAGGAPTGNFGYFTKVANRDSGGGWGGLWVGYSAGQSYFGRALDNTVNATWDKIWTEANDGAASGLDADLLDGQHGSFYLDANNFNAGTLLAARMPAHTGDATSTTGSVALTLATVNSNVGAFGSATVTPVVTVNAKGLVTAVSTATVTPAWASITSKPTTLSGYGITDAVKTVNGTAPDVAGNVVVAGGGGSDTAAQILAKLITVDGLGSGLDADLLDGQGGSYYQNATNINAGTLAAARLPAFTGDATSTAGSVALTLATVNSNVGAFGSATAAPVVTVNAKGLVTAVSTATVTPAWASITSKPTTLNGFGITDGSRAITFLPASSSAQRRYVRLLTVNGMDPNNGADISFILSGTGDFGGLSRGTAIVHVIERGGNATIKSWQLDVENTLDPVVFYLKNISTYVFEIWALFSDWNRNHTLTILNTGTPSQVAINVDSDTATAPAGITTTGVTQSTLYHSGNFAGAQILAQLLTVDGAASGLDADLLDAQDGSYYLNANNFNAGTLLAARMPAHTGDATSTAGSVALTLATVNSNVGAFGSATVTPVVTVNAKGLVTAVSTATVTPAWASITSKPTTASGYGITDVVKTINGIGPNGSGNVTVATSSGGGSEVDRMSYSFIYGR